MNLHGCNEHYVGHELAFSVVAQVGCMLPAKLFYMTQESVLSPADVQRDHSDDPDGFSMT